MKSESRERQKITIHVLSPGEQADTIEGEIIRETETGYEIQKKKGNSIDRDQFFLDVFGNQICTLGKEGARTPIASVAEFSIR